MVEELQSFAEAQKRELAEVGTRAGDTAWCGAAVWEYAVLHAAAGAIARTSLCDASMLPASQATW